MGAGLACNRIAETVGPPMTLGDMRELGVRWLPMKTLALAAFLIFFVSSIASAATDHTPKVAFLGFQLINISPGDLEIIKRMIEKYGSKGDDKRVDKRRTNLW